MISSKRARRTIGDRGARSSAQLIKIRARHDNVRPDHPTAAGPATSANRARPWAGPRRRARLPRGAADVGPVAVLGQRMCLAAVAARARRRRDERLLDGRRGVRRVRRRLARVGLRARRLHGLVPRARHVRGHAVRSVCSAACPTDSATRRRTRPTRRTTRCVHVGGRRRAARRVRGRLRADGAGAGVGRARRPRENDVEDVFDALDVTPRRRFAARAARTTRTAAVAAYCGGRRRVPVISARMTGAARTRGTRAASSARTRPRGRRPRP